MELGHLPIIDSHAHLFDVEYHERDLSEVFTLSLESPPGDQRRNSLFYRWFLKELASYFECKPEEKEVLAVREERAKSDYCAYVQELFSVAGIQGLVIDVGYKPASVSLETFNSLVPCQVNYLYRVETVLDKLWEKKLSFNKVLEGFDQAIQESMENPSFIGLKSIIGYRTGLALEKVSESKAHIAYDNRQEKAFRDFFLYRALEFCKHNKYPIQLHTSFGESNNNLLLNNPLLLKPLLQDEEFKELSIVLVHGGYPYTFETGYLCAMYPNVFCDISEFVPLVPMGMNKGILDIMDMCPLNKIMYGSDAFIIPEFNWFSAIVFKKRLEVLLAEIQKQGVIDEKYAYEVAELISYRNAAGFYGFDL